MTTNNLIKINGAWIPTPISYGWGMSDLDVSAERTASGILIRERIRSGVRKLTFTWDLIADVEMFYAFMRILDSLPATFEVTYPDAVGEMQTRTMYRSDVSTEMYRYDVATNNGYWKGCKVSFIEV